MKSENWMMFAAGAVLGLLLGLGLPKIFSGGGASAPPPEPLGAPKVNYEETINRLKTVVGQDPGNYQAWVELGNAYFDSGQPARSIEAYFEALKLDPSSPDVRTDMGIMLRQAGRPAEAQAAFREAMSRDPRHYISRYQLADSLLRDSRDYKAAMAVQEELIRLFPDDPRTEQVRQQLASLKEMVRQIESKESGAGAPAAGGPPTAGTGLPPLPPEMAAPGR